MGKKGYSPLRADIERVHNELKFTPNTFRALSILEWEAVQKKIETQFLVQRPATVTRSWQWNDIQSETYSLPFDTSCYPLLIHLIEPHEIVYFYVNETLNEQTKYWYYMGRIDAIIQIIGEVEGLDEYYVCELKQRWLLCENHHDQLIGTGEIIPKMKELAPLLQKKKA